LYDIWSAEIQKKNAIIVKPGTVDMSFWFVFRGPSLKNKKTRRSSLHLLLKNVRETRCSGYLINSKHRILDF